MQAGARAGRLRRASLVAAMLGLGATGVAQETLDLAALEARNAVFGTINITVEDVFDTSDPSEDKWLYRFANRVHMQSKRVAVRNILVFAPGDSFAARLLDESARALRATGFIADARVEARSYDEATNTVQVDVFVKDSWSLSPDLKLSRNGGVNEYGIGVSEDNLFGMGKRLSVAFTSDVDRDESYFEYFDRNVGGTRARLSALYTDASDGGRKGLGIGRPFFSLDSRWSVESSSLDDERVDSIYGLGEVIDEFSHDLNQTTIRGGWSRGLVDGRTFRWLTGMNLEEDRFSAAPDFADPLLLPEDRKLVYPWVGFQIVADDFREMSELNNIGRTEDVQVGLDFSVIVGRADERYGSDRTADVLHASVHKGWEPGGSGHLFLLDMSASARHEDVGIRNAMLEVSARYFRRNLEKHLFLTSLTAVVANQLDLDNQVLIGGDSGMRGYPLRFQSGERSAVLTFEQRFFTDLYLFRLIRVGYAVFLDVGRVWGADARGTPNLGTLYDVGVGLRLTSPRAAHRAIVHIDLAFPIDPQGNVDTFQLTVEKRSSF
jgi:hypothetical protein